LSAEITVFLHKTTPPTPDVAEQFAARGMKVRGVSSTRSTSSMTDCPG